MHSCSLGSEECILNFGGSEPYFDKVEIVMKLQHQAAVVRAVASSKLSMYLFVTRKMIAYDEEIGSHAALRLLIP